MSITYHTIFTTIKRFPECFSVSQPTSNILGQRFIKMEKENSKNIQNSFIQKHWLEWYTCNYYPTELHRIQIMPKMSTNIAQYLYSSYSPDERLKTLASQNFGKKKTKGAGEQRPFWSFASEINAMLSPLLIHSFYYWFRNGTSHCVTLLGSLCMHQTSRSFFTELLKTPLLFFVIFQSSKNGFSTQNSPKHNTKWI